MFDLSTLHMKLMGLIVPSETTYDRTAEVIEALAIVRCQSIEEIRNEMSMNGGDLKVSPKELAAVAAIMEEICGQELILPSDFTTPKTNPKASINIVSTNGCMDPVETTTIAEINNKIVNRLPSLDVCLLTIPRN